MRSSTTRCCTAGPTSFQTRNAHDNHLNACYVTRPELALTGPTFQPRQEPPSPGSGGFSALTPSQSESTFFTDHSAGLFGVQFSLNETHSISRGSKDDCTPENAFDDVAGVGGATGENPTLLRGINGSSRPSIYISSVHGFDGHTEGGGACNIAYPQPEFGRIQTLSNFTSNQSKQQAQPWSVLALQHHETEILPENLKDEDLAIASAFEERFADTDDTSHAQHVSDEATGLANLPPTEIGHRSSHKGRGRDRWRASKNTRKRSSQENQRLPGTRRRGTLSHATSVANNVNSTVNRGGRQEGYRFSEKDRISVKQVRDRGACFRCSAMKEKCTPGQSPCENCQRLAKADKFRLWMTPCSFKRLDERYEYLLPTSLASQVAVPRVRAFLNQHPARNPREFLLRLSIGFGEPWTFRAVEIWPQSYELSQMFVFRRRSVPGQQDLSPIQLTNPPVVPLWVDPLLMSINIDCWLERMIRDPQAGWQNHWFPDPSQIWQLEILRRICQHYRCHEPTRCDGVAKIAQQTLRWALKMSVLSYVMSHVFLVLESDRELLFQQLENPLFKGRVPPARLCPRAANKFVKMMVLPMLRLATQRTLSGLHQLFGASEPSAFIWDISFAVVFLCLMVVSSAQRSLFQRAAVSAANNDSSYTKADAASEAEMMDSELATHIIGRFHDTFHTASKRKGFNPFGNSGREEQEPLSAFAMGVRTTTQEHYQIPFDEDLTDIGAERLLAMFMRPFKLSSVPDVIAAW